MPQNKLKRGEYVDGQIELPGFPGYRTRDGRTGYDPLDTNREAAFMEGTFYRNLFTLKLRTRNPFYLVLMFLFGLVPFPFCLFATVQLILDMTRVGDFPGFFVVLMPLLYTAVTGFLSITLVLSLLEMTRIIPSLKNSKPRPEKEQKKRLPKRRKDFR